MGSAYPSALDDFAESSPTFLSEADGTGRTHPRRHDDVEAAVEQIEETLGTLPQGSDSTVRDRIAGAESDAAAALTAFNTHTHASTPPALAASGGTLTGALLLPDGTAAAPSLSNADDPNTGLLFPAADTVAVSTGGTERMRIASDGLITGTGPSLGAWAAYTPTVIAQSGTFTSVSATGKYCQVGKIVHVRMTITITTNGTAAGYVIATLPVNSVSVDFVGYGRGNSISGKQLQARSNAVGSVSIFNYDGTYPGTTGEVLIVQMTYEAA